MARKSKRKPRPLAAVRQNEADVMGSSRNRKRPAGPWTCLSLSETGPLNKLLKSPNHDQ